MPDSTERTACGRITFDRSRRGVCRLRVSGEFDIDNGADLASAVDAAVAGGDRAVLIDLAEVTFLGAAVLPALVRGTRVAGRRGCAVRVLNACPGVAWMLEASGTGGLLCGTGPVRRRPDAVVPRPRVDRSAAAEVVATSHLLVEHAHRLLRTAADLRAEAERAAVERRLET